MKIELPIGTHVNIFEKDGFETQTGKIIGYEGKFVYVKFNNCSKSGILKIPTPRIEISLTTKSNSLDEYLVENTPFDY